jgi:biopolymer transport protein ExbD
MPRKNTQNEKSFDAVELTVAADGKILVGEDELTLKQLIKVVRDRRESGQAARKADRVKAQAEKKAEQKVKAEAALKRAQDRLAKLAA